MHSALQPIKPASQAIPGSIQVTKAASRAMNEELADVAVPALADTEELLLAAGRVFSRDEAQPCGQIASLLELASAANSCQKCRGT